MNAELRFHGLPALRETARAWGGLGPMLDLPPHQRRAFVAEFEEKRMIETNRLAGRGFRRP